MIAKLALAAALLAATFAVGFGALQRRVLFPRPQATHPEPPRRPGLEVLWLGDAGDVEAWYLPPHDAGPRPAPALIFAHGNGELIDHWVDAFEAPRARGLGVLLVEYPGYGRSGGRPTQKSIARGMRDAFDALAARPDVDAARIVGHGRSLGGGAVCALAAQRPLAALILESTFTSVRDLARGLGVPGALVRDPFDSLEVVRAFEGPLLVVHGRHDRQIPVRHAHALHAAARHPAPLELLDCGHNDCPRPWPTALAFLEQRGLL